MGKVVKLQAISRTKASEMIENSKGQFMTIVFTKKNGDTRTINGNYRKGTMTKLGYFPINDMSKGEPRNVDPRKITKITSNGVTYRVR